MSDKDICFSFWSTPNRQSDWFEAGTSFRSMLFLSLSHSFLLWSSWTFLNFHRSPPALSFLSPFEPLQTNKHSTFPRLLSKPLTTDSRCPVRICQLILSLIASFHKSSFSGCCWAVPKLKPEGEEPPTRRRHTEKIGAGTEPGGDGGNCRRIRGRGRKKEKKRAILI